MATDGSRVAAAGLVEMVGERKGNTFSSCSSLSCLSLLHYTVTQTLQQLWNTNTSHLVSARQTVKVGTVYVGVV